MQSSLLSTENLLTLYGRRKAMIIENYRKLIWHLNSNITILTFDKVALIGVYLVNGLTTDARVFFNELFDKMLHCANEKINNEYEVIILGDMNSDPKRMNSRDRETFWRIEEEGFIKKQLKNVQNGIIWISDLNTRFNCVPIYGKYQSLWYYLTKLVQAKWKRTLRLA